MIAETTLSVDGEPRVECNRPVFYFDYMPVLQRSRALSGNPERIQLTCEHCVRRLAPSDLFVPQESGFFLIVQSCIGTAAEALAHEINIALLELFFGTEALARLGSICRRATLSELDAQGIKLSVAMKSDKRTTKSTESVEPDPLARLAQSGVPGYDGLATGFLPIRNVRNEAPSILLCGAIRRHEGKILFGSEALKSTDARDRASLDEAMLEYALTHARKVIPTSSAAAIGVTVSYETLSWSRGRQIYQKALRAAHITDNPFFLLKIEDVPVGTPPARLAEIVAMVRPFVKRVFLELPAWDVSILRAGNLGVAGFVAALPSDTELHAAARLLANVSKIATAQHAFSCVTNIEGTNLAMLSRSAGARFIANRVRQDDDIVAHSLGQGFRLSKAA